MVAKNSISIIIISGVSIALALLLLANWIGDSGIWAIALVLIALDAILIYALTKKAMDESYRGTLTIVEEFAKKNGFSKTFERGVLKYVWLKWSGYSLDSWEGKYQGREFRIGLLSLRKSPYPELIFEDIAIFIETSLEGKEKLEGKQEYYIGSTGVLGLSALCIVKGSKASVVEIEKAMASLKGCIRSQS